MGGAAATVVARTTGVDVATIGLCVTAGSGVATAGVGVAGVLSAATCFGVVVIFGRGDMVGVIEGSGDGLASCVGAIVGVGGIVGFGVGTNLEASVKVAEGAGAIATAVGNDAGALREPPKKCASTPPSSKPDNMTTRISGKSGNPPLGSSSNRRRRGGSLIRSRHRTREPFGQRVAKLNRQKIYEIGAPLD
jgi:hypothetical protein